MIKAYSLTLLFICCAFYLGISQTTLYSETFGTTGANGSSITVHESNNRFDEIGLTYSGTGDIRNTNASIGYASASSVNNLMINSNGETFIVDGLNFVSYSNITLSFGIRKGTTASNGSELIIEYSSAGTSGPYTALSFSTLPTGTGTTGWYYRTTSIIPNNATTIRFRGTNTIEWRLDDLLFEGSVISTDTPDFCNLQFPANGAIDVGGTRDVYAWVNEDGVTNFAGQGANILGWIGYSSSNSDPSGSGWTWVNASYVGDVSSGNDDEYMATLSGLSAGIYYYASRFQFNGGPYVYGGINSNGSPGGNFWDGTDYVNGILSVGTLDFCNLQTPASGTITLGGVFDVYGQVYEFGVTDSPGQGAGITAEIVYSTSNTNPNTWTNAIPAGYNTVCAFCGTNNDEYFADLGAAITAPGTYYYAMRYTLNSGIYVYGGILADGSAGNFWDGVTYISGVLTVEAPEIDVERNTFASIANGSAPNTGNNTIFASTTIGNTSATKTYYIRNEGDADLNVTSLTSSNATEFPIITNPVPTTILPGDIVAFDIVFTPTNSGTRTSTITVASDDYDENPYTFGVQGNGVCSSGSLNLSPTSGPENTIVTVTGTNFGPSTTANFNGLDASSSISVISSTELQVTVPTGAITGDLEVINDIGCSATAAFTIIDTVINGCDGSTSLTINGLFISEVTDKGTGSHSYVEIYNGMGITYNMDNYELRIHNNGSATATSTIQLSGSLASGNIYLVGFGGTNAADMEGGFTADVTSGVGGINDNDHIRLYYDDGVTESWVDLWGNTSNTAFTISSSDYVYRRLNSGITVPSTTWNPAEWTSATPVDYTDIRNFNYTPPTPPIVNGISAMYTSCKDVILTVSASEGFPGNNGLTYQWYYFDPNDASLPEWKTISDDATFSNSATNALSITNANTLSDYQFYCEVREDDATCFTASDAIKFEFASVTWNGATWLWSDGTPNGTAPTAANSVTLNAAYDTATFGSFTACNLTVTNGILNIENGNFVEIINDVTVTGGRIRVQTQGSFVQRGVGSDAGTFSLSGGQSSVTKRTPILQNYYDYVYWSSPINNLTISQGLFTTNPNRRYWFNASNFIDANVDGVDDNGDAWTLALGTDSMTPGMGVAATHDPAVFAPNTSYSYIFEGEFNTGDITYPVVYNTANNLSLHWNLLGNPYPSALNIDTFFSENSSLIYEAIYMWSHVSPPDAANPGNEVLNFNQNDYVTVNAVGKAGNGGDSNDDGVIDSDDIPERKVPSGQGFFIASSASGNVTFTNSMRVSGENENNQFFRTTQNFSTVTTDKETLWLNLSSDIGIYSQICVAYTDLATDAYDGNAIDTKRNYAGNAGMLYSMIDGDPYSNYVIQGKALNSLDEDEEVTIGFGAYISTTETYTLDLIKKEGSFLTSNPIYIKDMYLNQIHDLTISPYSFTSEGGTFNDRFSIVFKNENSLSNEDFLEAENGISIIELNDGQMQFIVKASNGLTFNSIKILDLQGRLIYDLKAQNSIEIFNLPNLSNAPFIAKLSLSNGQIITKKAVKRL